MAQDTANDEAEKTLYLWFPGLFGTGGTSGPAAAKGTVGLEGSARLAAPGVRRLDIGLPARMLGGMGEDAYRPENLPLGPEPLAALANEFRLLAKESARGSGALSEAALSLGREREEARAREEREALARLCETPGESGLRKGGENAPDPALSRAQRTLLLLWLEEKESRELDELIGRVEKGLSRLGEAFMADGEAVPGDAAPLANERDALSRWKTMLKNAVPLCPEGTVFVLDVPVDTSGETPAGIPDDLLALHNRASSCPFAERLADRTGRAARGLEIGASELFSPKEGAPGGIVRLVFLEGRA